ncbi:hypothetical protein IMY96_03885 [Pimelobacter simplex]|nr:hypothetical protein [Pimelobacter simplex]
MLVDRRQTGGRRPQHPTPVVGLLAGQGLGVPGAGADEGVGVVAVRRGLGPQLKALLAGAEAARKREGLGSLMRRLGVERSGQFDCSSSTGRRMREVARLELDELRARAVPWALLATEQGSCRSGFGQRPARFVHRQESRSVQEVELRQVDGWDLALSQEATEQLDRLPG